MIYADMELIDPRSIKVQTLNSSEIRGFNLKGAWELKEKYPIDSPSEKLRITIAHSRGELQKTLPKVDLTTQYQDAPGEARYLVEKKQLIKGGMGGVYRAWDKHLGKQVIIKSLHNSENIDFRNTIELEAKTMTRINHPGIPEIYNFFVADTPNDKNIPLMIMQYIEYPTLRERLDNGAPLSKDEIVKITTQISETIDYMAKKHNLFNGDIKPGNIFLDPNYVKLIDFGLASWVRKNMNDMIVGTPDYIAPEIVDGKPNTLQSEEFSFACTVYRVIAGFPPFEENTPMSIISRIINGNPILLREDKRILNKFWVTKAQDFDQIFAKALAKDPKQRYQTASEFAKAFCEVISSKQ